MKPRELTQFANSLLQGSTVQIELRQFQAKIKKNPTGLLTESWAKGFRSRYDEHLSSKRGYRINHIRLKDLTEDNVQIMYDLTYDVWVSSRVAVKLPESDWHYVDADGQRTIEENRVGRLVKHKLVHPKYVLFGDEVGTDTCQEDDGHIGGQVYLTANGKRAPLESSKSGHRFTVMCLTAATGDPVMFIIVYAATELDFLARFGYDHLAKEPFDKNKPIEQQIGPGKVFPGAPTCEFRGGLFRLSLAY